MAENATIRLNKVLRELNISLDRAVDYLAANGHAIEARPTTKISEEVHQVLLDQFQTDKSKKVASKEVGEEKRKEKEAIRVELEKEQEDKRLAREARANEVVKAKGTLSGTTTMGKIDLDTPTKKDVPAPEAVKEAVAAPKEAAPKAAPKQEVIKAAAKAIEKAPLTEMPQKEAVLPAKAEAEIKEETLKVPVAKEVSPAATETTPAAQPLAEAEQSTGSIATQYKKLSGPKIMGDKIDLAQFNKPKKKPVASSNNDDNKKRRKRIVSPSGGPGAAAAAAAPRQRGTGPRGKAAAGQRLSTAPKVEPTEEEVQKQVRETLEKLQGKSKKGKGAKYRRDKRDSHREQTEKDLEQQELESKILKVTEFVTANEVATMMDVSTTQIISACMSLGIMVTMNQRLDAETLSIVADEFGYQVEFVTADIEEAIVEVEDAAEDLVTRAPIVTNGSRRSR